LFFLIRYQQALNNYLNNDPDQSLWNIGEIRFRFPDSVKVMEITPLNILCLNSVRKWDEAYKLLCYYLENSGIDNSAIANYKGKVDFLYKKRNIPGFHSPKKAENLSRFIPGSGQMYTGAVAEGSVNFLLNATLLSFALYEFYTEYFITGYFVGLGLFNKTYHGGIRRAGLLADQKNKDALNKFNLETSSLIIKVIESANLKKNPIPWEIPQN
jgi:TM2 domain-containing membrane protein YozV